jgi:hypothetical protein
MPTPEPVRNPAAVELGRLGGRVVLWLGPLHSALRSGRRSQRRQLDLHAAYKRHYEAKAMNGSLESFDLHMKEMQQLRERLRQIVGNTDSHPL